MPKVPKGTVIKKPDLMSKPGKYFLNRHKGLNKKAAALAAGYADGQHTSAIENSVQYREIVKSYKDTLLDIISVEKIAAAHADNILQSGDRGARNVAIKMAIDKVEPEKVIGNDADKLIVVLRG